MRPVKIFIKILWAMLLAFAVTGCALLVPIKKDPKMKITVYPQTSASDSARFAMPMKIPYDPYEIYLKRIPLLTKFDIKSFRTYEADDGTYGALLYLKPHGEMALEQHTLANQRSYLVTMVEDRVVSTQYVDRPVRDGMFYIESGLTAEDVALMEESFDRVGGPSVGEGLGSDGEATLNLGEEEVFERVGDTPPAASDSQLFPETGPGSDEILTVAEEQERRAQGFETTGGPVPVAEAGFEEAPPLPTETPASLRPRRDYQRTAPAASPSPTQYYQPPFQ